MRLYNPSYCSYNSATITRSIVIIVSSFLLLIFFAKSSSPFSTKSGSDYGIFCTFGDFWLNGGIPYKDLFDNKGPYLFLIQLIGQWLSHGKWGIFLLEVLNLSFCIELLYRVGTMLLYKARKIYIIISLLFFLLFYVLTLNSGNSCESWSLPFVLLPLYLSLKDILSEAKEYSYTHTFIYGVCFGIISMIRINNAAIIAGIAIGLSYIYIKRKLLKSLLCNIGVFILGMIISVLPAIIYFAFYEALYDMLYATFIYNIKYKEVWEFYGISSIISNSKLLSPLLLSILVSFLYDKKTKRNTSPIILSASLACYFIFCQGATYLHYFMVVIPLFYIMFVMVSIFSPIIRSAFFIIPIIIWVNNYYCQLRIVGLLFMNKEITIHTPQEIFTQFQATANAPIDNIYHLDPFWLYWDFLYQVDRRPAGKYFTQQEEISKVDQYVHDDILFQFEKADPNWIISSKRLEESILKNQYNKYSLIDSIEITIQHDSMYLYKQRTIEKP